jgi:hypothetical protein
MLTADQFAEQQRALGRRIHEHAGVHWEEVYFGYCKPAFAFQAIAPGAARPARRRSVLGYSHRVEEPAQANRFARRCCWSATAWMDSGCRACRRKRGTTCAARWSIARCGPSTISNGIWSASAPSTRPKPNGTKTGFGAETPARRYVAEAESWRAQMRREFALAGREWWGAFVGDVLAAYLRTYQVEDVRIIEQAKTDTDCLKHHPMDALYFEVLSRAAADPACRLIVNGRPQHSSLNHFMEQFLFRPAELPYYSSNAAMVECGKRVWRGLARLRQFRRAPPPPQREAP